MMTVRQAGAGRTNDTAVQRKQICIRGHADCTDVPEGRSVTSGQVSVEAFSGVSAMWHWCHRRAAAVPHDKQRPPTHQRIYKAQILAFAREQAGLGHKVAMYACAS
jgi:hypothetical protein